MSMLPASAAGLRAEDEVTSICQDLLRIDSSNFGDNVGTGERVAAEYVMASLADVGLEPELFESSPRRASVAVRLPRTRGQRCCRMPCPPGPTTSHCPGWGSPGTASRRCSCRRRWTSRRCSTGWTNGCRSRPCGSGCACWTGCWPPVDEGRPCRRRGSVRDDGSERAPHVDDLASEPDLATPAREEHGPCEFPASVLRLVGQQPPRVVPVGGLAQGEHPVLIVRTLCLPTVADRPHHRVPVQARYLHADPSRWIECHCARPGATFGPRPATRVQRSTAPSPRWRRIPTP